MLHDGFFELFPCIVCISFVNTKWLHFITFAILSFALTTSAQLIEQQGELVTTQIKFYIQ